ncbi:MAG TPA: 50S ribosomal protein L9 [Clostridia bacterium]|nr:50S ribosomal protein L9 [Clostridia bacterium]
MKIVLKEDVKGLGKKGEMVNTSDGYARNFLLPRGLAVQANSKELNELKNREAAEKHRLEKEKDQAQESADKLKDKTLKISAKAGENGRLFGSVTAKEIAEQIENNFDVKIDRRKIVVEDIKSYGTYSVEVKLGHGIIASFYVLVGE